MADNLTHQDYVEQRFINKIAELNQKISDLESERKAVQKLLLEVRQERETLKGVTRINSATRILIERAILDSLKKGQRDIGYLYKQARLIDVGIKETTLRSYLHRLKSRNEIINIGKRSGFWKLAKPLVE